ncbi:PH domain-containing protein [Microbacterium sp. P05]|uniref:PH domain-containing protein n=1 Tax=Microbacterium sp. P05 TaxID=3366948 RepID=UPI0037454214
MLGGLALVCALLLADVVARGSVVQALLIVPWMLAVLWFAYVVWFASHVETDAEGITVQNLLRRTRVPWGRVTAIDLRWQVEVTLDDDTVVNSFGGPSPSRRGRLVTRSTPDSATVQTGRIVDDWIAAGDAAGGPVQRSWDVPALIALVVIAVWAVIAVLVAGV